MWISCTLISVMQLISTPYLIHFLRFQRSLQGLEIGNVSTQISKTKFVFTTRKILHHILYPRSDIMLQTHGKVEIRFTSLWFIQVLFLQIHRDFGRQARLVSVRFVLISCYVIVHVFTCFQTTMAHFHQRTNGLFRDDCMVQPFTKRVLLTIVRT